MKYCIFTIVIPRVIEVYRPFYDCDDVREFVILEKQICSYP